MERPYDPEPGVRGFLAGTPPILALAAVEQGARLVGEAGIGAPARRRPRRSPSFAVDLTTSASRRSASSSAARATRPAAAPT